MIHSGSQALTGRVSVTTNVCFLLSSGAPLNHSELHDELNREETYSIDLEVVKSHSGMIDLPRIEYGSSSEESSGKSIALELNLRDMESQVQELVQFFKTLLQSVLRNMAVNIS